MATLDSTKIFGDLDVNGNFQLRGSNLFSGNIRNYFGELGVKIGLSDGDDPQIQLQGDGTNVAPHIDFASGLNEDYDARIILNGDDMLEIRDAKLQVTDQNLVVKKNLQLTGDLQMMGTDSYIWTPDTATGYTGFWDPHNNKALLHATNESGGKIKMKAPIIWEGDQDFQGIYWGTLHKDAAAHSGAWGYIRQGVAAGQLELGSDELIEFYETDVRALAVQIKTNAKTLDAKGGLLEGGVKLQDKYLETKYLSGREVADANTLDTKGVRFDYLKGANKPAGTDHAIMTQAYSNAFATQMASDWRTNKWYVRNQNNGTWASWDELVTKSLGTSLYLGKTAKAADADKLDGINSSSFLRSDATDSFTNLSGTSITLGAGAKLKESSHRADLLLIEGQTSGWAGIQIDSTAAETVWSLMADGTTCGLYDDTSNVWLWQATDSAGVRLYYNGAEKLDTQSYGVEVTGNLKSTSDIFEKGGTLASRYLGKTAKAADSEKVDGYSVEQLMRRIDNNTDYKTTTNIMTLQQKTNSLPVGLTGAYAYGGLLTFNDEASRLRIYAPHNEGGNSAIYFNTGWNTDQKAWERVLTYTDGDAKYLAKTATAAKATWADTVDVNASTSGSWYNINWHSGDTLYGANGKMQIQPSTGKLALDDTAVTLVSNIQDITTAGRKAAICIKDHKSSTSDSNTQFVPFAQWTHGLNTGYRSVYAIGSMKTSAWTGGMFLGVGSMDDVCDSYFLMGNDGNITYRGESSDAVDHTFYHTGNKPTAADIGAAPASHTHSGYAPASHTHSGYAAASHSHSYLPLGGGRITGNLEINKDAPTVMLRDTNNKTAFLHNNSNIFYVLRSSGNNGTTWDSGPNSRHPMLLYLDNGNVVFSGNVTAYSDENLKEKIEVIESPLEKIEQIRGVTYHWKNDEANVGRQVGVIAQEVQKVLPEVVVKDRETGNLTVAYANMVGLLIEGTKELNSKVNSQEETIKNQQSEIDELKKMVKLLASKVGL